MTGLRFLSESLGSLVLQLVADKRSIEIDSVLAQTVVGMILYGYAFELGSSAFGLGPDDAERAVRSTLGSRVGCEGQLAADIALEAKCCLLDPQRHRGHSELIEVGMGYIGCDDLSLMVDNVLLNVLKFKSVVGDAAAGGTD